MDALAAATDLSRATLIECELRGANLIRADLRGALFCRCDLEGAQTHHAPRDGMTVVASETTLTDPPLVSAAPARSLDGTP